MEKKKLSWVVDFIRENHPEYGVLTQCVFAPNETAVIEYVKSGYGENSQIISIK